MKTKDTWRIAILLRDPGSGVHDDRSSRTTILVANSRLPHTLHCKIVIDNSRYSLTDLSLMDLFRIPPKESCQPGHDIIMSDYICFISNTCVDTMFLCSEICYELDVNDDFFAVFFWKLCKIGEISWSCPKFVLETKSYSLHVNLFNCPCWFKARTHPVFPKPWAALS